MSLFSYELMSKTAYLTGFYFWSESAPLNIFYYTNYQMQKNAKNHQ